jgi:virulence factor
VSVFYKNYLGQPAYYRGAIDILTSDAIHAVDMLRWMCGEPAEVRSIVLDRGNPYYTTFHSLMRFENGSTGVLLADWTVGGRVHRFEMHGKGISAFSDPNSEATILADNGQAERIGTFEAADSEEFRVYYGFEAQSRHFIDCVRSGKQPMTSLADAAKTMELVERIYREAI